ncbi:glycosyltransferase [candidate division KSB1 bacterium]|nr:glycosyltransferase [candidate division KSB1 bacterium]
MKILVISHLFPNAGNKNYGIFFASYLIEMEKQGMDITVIVPTVWTPFFLKYFKKWKEYNHNIKLINFKGIKTVTTPYLRITGNWFFRWAGLSAFLSLKNKAKRLHQKNKYDIIYSHMFFPDGDVAVRLSRQLKIPAVCVGIGRDVNIIPNYYKGIYKRFVKICNQLDGTISYGQAVADKIDAISNKKTLSVYGVVDLNKFKPVASKNSLRKELGIPEDKTVVLYLSTFKKDKGVYELLEAFKRVLKKCPNAILEICGWGIEKAGMIRYIQENSLENEIKMIGSVDHEKVDLWMKACDLFVLPTYHEGMPNAVMEAMACGLPVLVSAVGGLPDAIGDSEGAVLIPPKDVKILEESMSKILNDEKQREKMSIAARKRAEERFGAEKTVSTLITYLGQIVEQY